MDQKSKSQVRKIRRNLRKLLFYIMVAKGIYFVVRLFERLIEFVKQFFD